MIEREAGERGEGEMELYVGEGEGRLNLVNLKSRMMFEKGRGEEAGGR